MKSTDEPIKKEIQNYQMNIRGRAIKENKISKNDDFFSIRGPCWKLLKDKMEIDEKIFDKLIFLKRETFFLLFIVFLANRSHRKLLNKINISKLSTYLSMERNELGSYLLTLEKKKILSKRYSSVGKNGWMIFKIDEEVEAVLESLLKEKSFSPEETYSFLENDPEDSLSFQQ